MSKKTSINSVINTNQSQPQFSIANQKSYLFFHKQFQYSNKKKALQIVKSGRERQKQTQSSSIISRYDNKKENSNKVLNIIGDRHRSSEIKKHRQNEPVVIQYRNELTSDELRHQKQPTVRTIFFYDQGIQQQPAAEAQQNIPEEHQYIEVERCKEKQQELKNFMTCEICCEQYSEQHQVQLSCSHSACEKCMLKYSQQLILQHKQIKCPFSKCGEVVNNKLLLEKLPSAIYRKYKQSTHFMNNVNRNGVLICPNQQCDEGLLILNKSVNQNSGQQGNSNIFLPKLQCNKCKLSYCNNCLKNTSVQQYHAQCNGWKEQELQIQKNNDFKKCQKCRRFVQKSKGCNHMTCKCGHQFCYKCGQAWKFTHICNPFELKKLMTKNRENKLNKIQNPQLNENSSIILNDDQSPKTSQYIRYVIWMIGYTFWTVFAFIFCLLPVVLSLILVCILYSLVLTVFGLTYGYLMVLCQVVQGSRKIIVKILFILIPVLAMIKGVTLIYLQNIYKVSCLCSLLMKLADLLIPFQINSNSASD